MTRHHVEISTDGVASKVLLDGHDIARALMGLTFTAGVGELPQLRLDLRLIDVTELGSKETQVVLGDGVEETLKRLGWTPPEEKQP